MDFGNKSTCDERRTHLVLPGSGPLHADRKEWPEAGARRLFGVGSGEYLLVEAKKKPRLDSGAYHDHLSVVDTISLSVLLSKG